MDRILLLDGLNLIYRANIKFGAKQDKSKTDYTIVYNFFRSLRALVEEFEPRKLFFALEGGHSFRKALYGDYKANRIIKLASTPQEKQDDFNRQRDIIIELIKYLPITSMKSDTYEADDIIYSLVENLKDEEVIVISNDKDFGQLLQKGYKHVKVYSPTKKQFVESPTYHLQTFLTLNGDASDNIPSLMGKKKAEKLASDHKELALFLNDNENRANYTLNKELVELKLVPDDELLITDFKVDFDHLKAKFTEFEFPSMIEDKYWTRFIRTFEGVH
jgi:5'-3' exonuclease